MEEISSRSTKISDIVLLNIKMMNPPKTIISCKLNLKLSSTGSNLKVDPVSTSVACSSGRMQKINHEVFYAWVIE